MAYLNLLLRRKADEAATPDERASLLKEADDLVDKAKEIKQKKMETPAKILAGVLSSFITSAHDLDRQAALQGPPVYF